MIFWWLFASEYSSLYKLLILFLFPDKGACDRYQKAIKSVVGERAFIGYGEKSRDWETSNITSYKLNLPNNISLNNFSNIIVMDDIISTGQTIKKCLNKITDRQNCDSLEEIVLLEPVGR